MSNYCKDCQYSSNVTSPFNAKCYHPTNYSKINPVTGDRSFVEDLYNFRVDYCNGKFFKEKPVRGPWWKLWWGGA